MSLRKMVGSNSISDIAFNLVDASWIPVRWLDGHHSLVGLNEIFRNASAMGDLDAVPHERIAILRLLVCIVQAALGAPATDQDWPEFGRDMEEQVTAYLARPEIARHFEVFGDGPRFLQCKAAPGDKSYAACQASFTLAAGNSPTLFDHFGEAAREMTPAYLARLLLAYQNFFVGGSMASKVKGNGPCLKMLHTFLIGRDLKHTLLSNCLDAEGAPAFGRPYWELGTPDEIRGSLVKQATETYLGRLVPLSCRLEVTGTGPEGYFIHIDQGLEYPAFPAWIEPSATQIPFKEEVRLLRADPNRGIWRDLHCIAVIGKPQNTQSQAAPKILQSHVTEREGEELDLWVGELIKAKDAKIIDGVEDRFTVPYRLFTDGGRRMYGLGVEHANEQARAIYSAVKAYAEEMKNNSPAVDAAQQHFWHSLDQQRQLLLALVKDDTAIRGSNFGEAYDPWSRAVWSAAHAAYDFACPRVTPRQIQAYALGLRNLRPKSAKSKAAKKAAKSSSP